MEYTSQEELYIKLLPVFKVKRRLNNKTKYPSITNIDIWKYLIKTKWKHSVNLTISEVVNDIIIVDPNLIYKFKGGEL